MNKQNSMQNTQNYGEVPTLDGSITLYNAEFNQNYHSTSGAIDEALQKHVLPCQISNGMTIVDYCFGLGYNSLVAMSQAQNLIIYALENDAAMLLRLSALADSLPPAHHDLFSSMTNQIIQHIARNEVIFSIQIQKNIIHFFIGDARDTIIRIPSDSCDAIFWDPFSPKACPQLWAESEFTQAFRILKKNGRLSTYSCARVVRDNMRGVGFHVIDGPIVGRRSPSTIGIKK
jgi:tRNA U34 5-methylaminomethyl-2-thiouridine-forming methyltransferase MnmC